MAPDQMVNRRTRTKAASLTSVQGGRLEEMVQNQLVWLNASPSECESQCSFQDLHTVEYGDEPMFTTSSNQLGLVRRGASKKKKKSNGDLFGPDVTTEIETLSTFFSGRMCSALAAAAAL